VVEIHSATQMLVELRWQGYDASIDYGREVLVQGIRTSKLKADDIVPLPGVFKVVAVRSLDAQDSRTVEVPVLIAVDISRHMEDAYLLRARKRLIEDYSKIRQEIDFSEANRAVAAKWLQKAQDAFDMGKADQARKWFKAIIDVFPNTPSATPAQARLDDLKVNTR
jgi:hypothetical protein